MLMMHLEEFVGASCKIGGEFGWGTTLMDCSLVKPGSRVLKSTYWLDQIFARCRSSKWNPNGLAVVDMWWGRATPESAETDPPDFVVP